MWTLSSLISLIININIVIKLFINENILIEPNFNMVLEEVLGLGLGDQQLRSRLRTRLWMDMMKQMRFLRIWRKKDEDSDEDKPIEDVYEKFINNKQKSK